MAGEWLKFECSLPDKPETLAITVAMGWDDPDLTVGKLMRLFRWFDQHTTDGNARGVTAALLDRLIGVTGFVQAVANTGWLVIEECGLTLHNFSRHNGATAKSRSLTAKRVANHRGNAEGNAESNGASVTEALAREEKRREEKKEKKETRKRAPDLPCPEDVGEEVWADWLKLRASKKAAVTATVLNAARRESGKAGMTLEAFLQEWCLRGSQGLSADWLKTNPRGNVTPINRQEAIEARNRAVGDEWVRQQEAMDASR